MRASVLFLPFILRNTIMRQIKRRYFKNLTRWMKKNEKHTHTHNANKKYKLWNCSVHLFNDSWLFSGLLELCEKPVLEVKISNICYFIFTSVITFVFCFFSKEYFLMYITLSKNYILWLLQLSPSHYDHLLVWKRKIRHADAMHHIIVHLDYLHI